MQTKSVGTHVGSSEAGRNVELSHQEVNTTSPCNCDNSIVILGNVNVTICHKTTGCAFNMQYMMKFPHQLGGFFASPNSLPPIQTLLQWPGSRAGIPLWMHTFLQNGELRNRATVMEICFYSAFIHQPGSIFYHYLLSLPRMDIWD